MKTEDDLYYDAIPMLDASQRHTGKVIKVCTHAIEALHRSPHKKNRRKKNNLIGNEAIDTDHKKSRQYCQSFFKTFDDDILATNKHSRMLNAIKRREMHGNFDAKNKKLVDTQFTGQSVPQAQYNSEIYSPRKLPFSFSTWNVLYAGVLQKQGSWRQNWKRVRNLFLERVDSSYI